MAKEKAQELYLCDGCTEHIQTNRARIQCHKCPGYHLCANCYVIKQFDRPHSDSHPTMILKQSGIVVPIPPGFSPRPPALPPRANMATSSKQSSRMTEIPTANWGTLWNIMKAPLEKKDKKGRKASVDTSVKGEELREVPSKSSSTMNGALERTPDSSPLSQHPSIGFPPSPPKSVRRGVERMESLGPSYPQPTAWEPLFEDNMTPTPIFVALMSSIFSKLDPEHTGYLSPEIYSEFLETQGYHLAANTWKHSLEIEDGEHSKDVADLELGLYFSDLDISHVLRVRPRNYTSEDTEDEPASAVEIRIRQSMSFNANMPMLSRQGFIDVNSIEYLKDPSKGYEHLARAVCEYGVWTELGEMPRAVLPDKSTPKNSRMGQEDTEVDESKTKLTGANATTTLGGMNLKGGEAKINAITGGEEFEYSSSPEESETPPVLGDLRRNGGEAKVDAIIKDVEFDETCTPRVGTPSPMQSPLQKKVVDERVLVIDTQVENEAALFESDSEDEGKGRKPEDERITVEDKDLRPETLKIGGVDLTKPKSEDLYSSES